MILPLQQAVRAALRDTLATLYGPEAVPAHSAHDESWLV